MGCCTTTNQKGDKKSSNMEIPNGIKASESVDIILQVTTADGNTE